MNHSTNLSALKPIIIIIINIIIIIIIIINIIIVVIMLSFFLWKGWTYRSYKRWLY